MTEIPMAGCALCRATWGDHWDDIDGKRLFFCCDVCGREYSAIVEAAKKRKGWSQVDAVEMQGDFRGRICTVRSGSESYRFLISFFEEGEIKTFIELYGTEMEALRKQSSSDRASTQG